MTRVKDLTGRVFGKLTVIANKGKSKSGHHLYLCECACGGYTVTQSCNLLNGHTKSCGCLRSENVRIAATKHGMSYTSTYRSWGSMLRRCNHKNADQYHNYGGRGITVCERWHSFEKFYEDMGKKPHKNYSIERVNNSLGYTPGNCKWASPLEQSRNRRHQKSNKVGVCGVSFDKRRGKYKAEICVHGKKIYLGRFRSKTAAVEARINGEKKYFTEDNYEKNAVA